MTRGGGEKFFVYFRFADSVIPPIRRLLIGQGSQIFARKMLGTGNGQDGISTETPNDIIFFLKAAQLFDKDNMCTRLSRHPYKAELFLLGLLLLKRFRETFSP
jgi:hypothetical protein